MVDGKPRETDEVNAAKDVFLEFLLDRQDGGAGDFEELCRSHPELEPELRRMEADHRWLESYFDDPAPPGQVASLPEGLGTGARPSVETDPPKSRYTYLGELARGGMGSILRVWDEGLRRELAMKVALPRLDGSERGRSRFLLEAQVTAQLDHPGVVPVHELGEDDEGRSYFTMRRVKGRELSKIFALARSGEEGWSISRAVGVLIRACETLAFAHSKGVVHRDLKPDNVMVGDFGEVYLMDWGLARVTGVDEDSPASGVRTDWVSHDDSGTAGLTQPGALLGTAPFLAPELALKKSPATTLSDVYALGAMLYDLLAGTPPYVDSGERPSANQVLARLQLSRLASLDAVASAAPVELVAVCEKAMARDRRQRYADPMEMAADMRAWSEGRVVQAFESGAWAELKKWVRRNRAIAGTAAALLAVFLGGSLAFAWSQTQAARRDRERLAEITSLNERLVVEEREAQTEATRATTALDLTKDLLSAANPYELKGPEYTVRQLLDDFRFDELDVSLDEMPDVEVTIRGVVGDAYVGLALYDRAQTHLGRARALAEHGAEMSPEERAELARSWARLLRERGDLRGAAEALEAGLVELDAAGGAHEATVATMLVDLSSVRLDLARFDEAGEAIEEALRIDRRLFAEWSPEVLRDLAAQAALSVEFGHYAEGEELFRRVLNLRREQASPGSPEIAGDLQNLAAMLFTRGDFDEAERLYRDALALQRNTFGEEHPAVAIALRGVAKAVGKKGDPREALGMHQQALDMQRSFLGNDHPQVALSLNNLGATLQEMARYKEAEEHHREALRITRLLLGDRHPYTTAIMASLANDVGARGDVAESLRLSRRVLEINLEDLGEDHPRVARARTAYGNALLAIGDYDAAEVSLRALIEGLRRVLPDNPKLAEALVTLSGFLIVRDQLGEAEAVLLEALELDRRVVGVDHWRVAKDLTALASVMIRQKRLDEAEPLLLDSLSILERSLGPQHPTSANSLLQLGVLYRDRLDGVAALRALREAADIRRKTGDQSWSLAVVLNEIGSLLRSMARYSDAQEVFEEALALTEQDLGTEHHNFAVTSANYGHMLAQKGDLLDAEHWLGRALETFRDLHGDQHPHVAATATRLSSVLLAQGRHEEAEALLDELGLTGTD